MLVKVTGSFLGLGIFSKREACFYVLCLRDGSLIFFFPLVETLLYYQQWRSRLDLCLSLLFAIQQE